MTNDNEAKDEAILAIRRGYARAQACRRLAEERDAEPEPPAAELARLRAELAAAHETIRQLAERLAAASEVLGRAAEKRPDLFPPKEG